MNIKVPKTDRLHNRKTHINIFKPSNFVYTDRFKSLKRLKPFNNKNI